MKLKATLVMSQGDNLGARSKLCTFFISSPHITAFVVQANLGNGGASEARALVQRLLSRPPADLPVSKIK